MPTIKNIGKCKTSLDYGITLQAFTQPAQAEDS